jgi:hypothetical protein
MCQALFVYIEAPGGLWDSFFLLGGLPVPAMSEKVLVFFSQLDVQMYDHF